MSISVRDLFRKVRESSTTRGRNRCALSLSQPRRDADGLDDGAYCLAAWAAIQAGWCGLPDANLHEIAAGVVRRWDVNLASLSAGELVRAVATGRRTSVVVAPEGVDAAWMDAHDGASHLDIPLVVGLDPSRTELVADFDSAIIALSQADTVLRSIAMVAHALRSEPNGRVDAIHLAAGYRVDAEQFEYDPAQSVDSVFAAVAAVNAERLAVVQGDARLTYSELDRRSNDVAAHLIGLGVAPGSTVAVAFDRSIEVVPALVGILKAGCAFMPIDVAHPSDRLAEMFRAAHTTVGITVRRHRDIFPAEMQAVVFEDVPSLGASGTTQRSAGDSIAYVMFTSGSTGKPKGVEVFHKSILRLVRGSQFADLSESCVMLQAAPLGFDASTLELWGPLLNGGCCVIHDEAIPTPVGLGRTIRRHGVTTAWLTSGLFNSVVDEDPQHLSGLKQLLIGGEALSVAHVRRFLAAVPSVELINGYGPTECTTFTTTYKIPVDLPADVAAIPIGGAIGATTLYVLSPSLRQVPPGIAGELYVGGLGVARGYLNDAELTRQRFIDNPYGPVGDRLYKTGDVVRLGADGNLEFLGRADRQVKVRGFRIEPAEIELALGTHPQVRSCAVAVDRDRAGNARLIAYVVTGGDVSPAALREFLAALLPPPMVPSFFVPMSSLPLTANGKINRDALPPAPHDRPELAEPYRAPVDDGERAICDAFSEALGISQIGRADNFFELGGNSLLMLRVLTQLERRGMKKLPPTAFFEQPTPEALAKFLNAAPKPESRQRAPRQSGTDRDDAIAIVAMTGRFPGATNVAQFWRNLCDARDTIRTFSIEELDKSLPADLITDPAYVKRRGVIDGAETFDAAFFGISPRAAELMDPQHRVFLELCWECLEIGGYRPDRAQQTVGVFAGMYNASYFQKHLVHRPDLVNMLGEFQVMLANEKDYLASRVAHKLNLVGPAVSVYTACSTSLVAIAQAFAALRAGQCDLALAGGVSITCPINSGYLHQEGAMLSPDGVTRTFDAQAGGTVFSDGAGVILLKRLKDALADNDLIHAVLRGVGVNNDGRDKASFTAPSVGGQSAVIRQALVAADVRAGDLSYIEAHGTATPLGDPVEIEALAHVFREDGASAASCRIGSLKSNVGHLVIASGVAGVIKTALALQHELLPPTLHYSRPNPNIDLANSPFVVNDRLTKWPRTGTPRLAGVSSFGVGGTNAHAILEEAPRLQPSSAAAGPQLLRLSARTPAALATMASELAAHLHGHGATNLADAAHTLQVGRSEFSERLIVVASTTAEAVTALRTSEHQLRASQSVPAEQSPLVMMFPGQGAQYARMGSGLYNYDPFFREAIDQAFAAVLAEGGPDLRGRLFEGSAEDLQPTAIAQPAIFCIEYALGHALLRHGLRPASFVGHSVGEFAAAVLAGVMTLDAGARLIARRGALMQSMPAGAMLSIRMSADEVQKLLTGDISIAAINAPTSCVVAGPVDAIAALEASLAASGAVSTRLQTSHAFHSSMMDPVVAPYEAEVRRVKLSPPQIPIISSVTGKTLSAAAVTDPAYWAGQLRAPVRFSAALQTALAVPAAVFLEVGPRGTLASFVRQHAKRGEAPRIAINSLADTVEFERAQFLFAAGRLWTMGIDNQMPSAFPLDRRRRIALPAYAFERKRYWIEAKAVEESSHRTIQVSDISRSDEAPAMNKAALPVPAAPAPAAASDDLLIAELRTVFENVTGIELADADASVTFVELGLDSLALTQAALQVKKHFKVPITFRQLMEQHRTFTTLAAFVATQSPEASKYTAPQPAAPATAAAAAPTMPTTPFQSSDANTSLVRDVIQQQVQLMNEQLALLKRLEGGAVAPAPAVVAAVAPQASPSAPSRPVLVASTAATPDAPVKQITYDVKKSFGAIARIHTSAQALTDRQKVRLEKFIERYCARTAKSKAYTVAHRPHLADPRVVNGFRPVLKEITYQIVIERSKGSRLWDLDGNEYIDALNGFGMNLFGWQPEFVNDAVRAQLDRGYDIGPQHPLAGEVAQLICEMTGNDRAGLCNTGSEAVMAAIRIARTVTGRSTVVVFTGSYHGTFDEVVVRAGRDRKGIPGAPGIMAGMYGDLRVLDYGTDESLEFIRQNIDDIAAVLVEPVQSRRPDFQPIEFLREVRKVTETNGACLIFDEVITGFRSSPGGTQALFGIRADLAAYGKVIGGGFPIGAVAGKREYMDALDGGPWNYGDASIPTVGVTYFAGTFVRHPLALAAAKASLLELRRESPGLQERLTRQTAEFAAELNAFCAERGAPIKIQHFASLWRVSWLEDHPLQDLLFAIMRDRGIHILDNFPCFMTTAHTAADLTQMANTFKAAVNELQEAGFLPRTEPAVVADASKPPVAGARLALDKDGKPAWFVPDANTPGKYTKHQPAKVPTGTR